MNTTALIVEMVIIGFQVAIWLAILLAFGWGFDAGILDRLEKLATPLTLAGVAVCYTIGLVVDAVAAWLEDRLIPSYSSKEERAARRAMRQRLRLNDRELYRDLERDEYLLRLLRSTAFNICIISLLGTVLLLKTRGLTDGGAWGYVAGLLLLAVVAVYGWWRRRCNFVANRNAFYLALAETQSKEPSRSEAVATTPSVRAET